jgi:murein DD-endopeptidase MepM/ murein hydrolase activator NlpD
MKIKLTESQLINTLKNGYGLNESEPEALANFLKTWADLKKDNETGDNSALGKMAFDAAMMNPNFDFENADLKDFETIDVWPVNNSTLTSGFGKRTINGVVGNHGGVDLGVPTGTPVYSPANGVVVSAKNSAPNPCGGFVQIKHDKYETKYCHLIRFDVVKQGDQVVKGQIIGYTGGGLKDPFRGNSYGPHLHYEVLVNGKNVNPTSVHTKLS